MEKINYYSLEDKEEVAYLYRMLDLKTWYTYYIAIRLDGHNIVVFKSNMEWLESGVYSSEPI